MICTKCGAANRPGAKFCDECGQSLKPAEAPALVPGPHPGMRYRRAAARARVRKYIPDRINAAEARTDASAAPAGTATRGTQARSQVCGRGDCGR